MEVSSAAPLSNNDPSTYDNTIMMDMDMEIDLGEDMEPIEMEIMNEDPPLATNSLGHDSNVPMQVLGSEGQDVVSDKVHIRGLDNLTTEDLKAFAAEHFSADIVRYEWIDDTSANLVYETPELAAQALSSFIQPTESYIGSAPLQLLTAKRLSSHPNAELRVRYATTSDVKAPRAREASRFYLMNPEKDPREKRRDYDSRYGRRQRHSDRKGKRELDDDEQIPFDVNMYDDDPDSLAARENSTRSRRRSRSGYASDDSRGMKRQRFGAERGGDLFADRMRSAKGGNLRNRSASPLRNSEGDGRLGFGNEGERANGQPENSFRQRDSTPPLARKRVNARKERFSRSSDNLTKGNSGRDLFSDRMSSEQDQPAKELFPRKNATGNHRRTAAFDAADGTGDLFANGIHANKVDSIAIDAAKTRSLADRISGGPTGSESVARGRGSSKNNNSTSGEQLEGFSIRGAAAQESGGFAIRGSAAQSTGFSSARVKELFPDKGEQNSGKDLFSRIKGAPRKRAEDMF